jgi:replication factor A1
MKDDVKKLVERIAKETDLDEEEVVKRIDSKEEEYNGLISKEGAAHIVAKEAGVNLLEGKEKSLDIDNIVSGMNSVTVTGKVQRIFETREFERDGEKGKVANIILADESGSIRVSFWNEEVEKLIEEGKIEEGSVIKIESGYVKKDNRDNLELRLGRSGKVKKSDKEIEVEVSEQKTDSTERTDIEVLSPGDRGEIRGTLVNIFANNPFFMTCPECDKRVEEECEEHGESQPNLAISGVIDDGTENIRAVFFREQAEKLVGMETDEIWELTKEGDSMDDFVDKCENLIGDDFVLQGRVKMNDFFGRPEFMVDSVDALDPKKEAERIISSI